MKNQILSSFTHSVRAGWSDFWSVASWFLRELRHDSTVLDLSSSLSLLWWPVSSSQSELQNYRAFQHKHRIPAFFPSSCFNSLNGDTYYTSFNHFLISAVKCTTNWAVGTCSRSSAKWFGRRVSPALLLGMLQQQNTTFGQTGCHWESKLGGRNTRKEGKSKCEMTTDICSGPLPYLETRSFLSLISELR